MSWDPAARAKFLLVGFSCRHPTSINDWYLLNTRARNDVIKLLAVEQHGALVLPHVLECAFFFLCVFCLCVHADALPKRCVVEVVMTCLKSRSEFREADF